jgi:hypothetical protein
MYGSTFPKPDYADEDPSFNQRNGGQQGGYQGSGHQSNNGGDRGYNRDGGQNNYQGNNRGNWNNDRGGNGGNGGGGNWQNRQNNNGGKSGGFKRKPETDFSLYLPYAVTGNPNPPEQIIARFENVAKRLDQMGFTARTRGFEGIEDAVEKVVKKVELLLPWRDFNQKESKTTWTKERAYSVAKMFHPGYDALKKSVQTFLAANARILLGDSMAAPALFLLVWSEDGCNDIRRKSQQTSFAAHSIAIASSLGIPIYNLQNPDDERKLYAYLDQIVLPQNPQGEAP